MQVLAVTVVILCDASLQLQADSLYAAFQAGQCDSAGNTWWHHCYLCAGG
jgi:hypothetical protein